MIDLTRLNGTSFSLNEDLIEIIEETPDTVITLTNGHRYIVKESIVNINSKIVEYKRSIFTN